MSTVRDVARWCEDRPDQTTSTIHFGRSVAIVTNDGAQELPAAMARALIGPTCVECGERARTRGDLCGPCARAL